MGKFKNTLKRNKGFLVLCVLAGGASFVTADMAMSDMLPEMDLPFLAKETSKMVEGPAAAEQVYAETVTEAVRDAAREEVSTGVQYETDPFTITASGSVIKGVEGETVQTEAASTDWNLPEETGAQPQEAEPAAEPAAEEAQPETIAATADEPQPETAVQTEAAPQTEAPVQTEPQTEALIIEGTPNDVVLWGISSRYIDESELYVMDEQALRLMRNEICALHGRIFESEDLREFFSKRSWYKPTVDPEYFDANMDYILNDYEKANLETIYAYEQALKYGEDWWQWEE